MIRCQLQLQLISKATHIPLKVTKVGDHMTGFFKNDCLNLTGTEIAGKLSFEEIWA